MQHGHMVTSGPKSCNRKPVPSMRSQPPSTLCTQVQAVGTCTTAHSDCGCLLLGDKKARKIKEFPIKA
eukprot:5622143-Amphidinium_carterae.1